MLAATSGALGSLFSYSNGRINVIRKQYLDTKWKKLLETGGIAALTATVLYFTPGFLEAACIPMKASAGAADPIRYMCPEGTQNPIATLLFNPQSAVIKDFLSLDVKFSPESLLPLLLICYALTTVTYGTFIPAGLFVPGILIGCTIGRLAGLSVESLGFADVHLSTYAIIGATSFLAGYSRLSFSLAVMMLETSQNVNLFLPILLSIFVASATGGLFTKSLYVNAIKSKAFPFLVDRVPEIHQGLKAADIMSGSVKTLPVREKAAAIRDFLVEHAEFNGFPVVNEAN